MSVSIRSRLESRSKGYGSWRNGGLKVERGDSESGERYSIGIDRERTQGRGRGRACCAEAGLHWDRGCWGLQWWLYRGVAGCSFARGLRLLAGLGTEVRLRLLLVPVADGCWVRV